MLYYKEIDDRRQYMTIIHDKKKPLQNSKTPEEREKAKQTLDDLFATARPAKQEISLNGQKEAAEAIWKKYESLK